MMSLPTAKDEPPEVRFFRGFDLSEFGRQGQEFLTSQEFWSLGQKGLDPHLNVDQTSLVLGFWKQMLIA